ncbi:hypothetical protein DVR12_12995 [Chitinophaga silvatica]|uniref:Uncharacterized protein n=1 Tax=Chitinophaga silvatica TaxID=2282649 RepID=A0A3E1YAD6_9BACT|nr:BpuSI family type II restriction endonuclease [Chitinophaga silvatica]RFS22704.1 hypothetical protein DVR12_12995 [Chitinophaga silvatica]
MPQLWYNYDEVADFHPLVEQALQNALVNKGYNNIAEIVHHPSIPNSSITPDFAIRLKSNHHYIFICEVKRTERDVESQRYQNQTRSYVTDAGPHWAVGYHKYFCITNIERLILLADRNGPLMSCVLRNNPIQNPKFNPATHDATDAVAGLQNAFETILPVIFNRTNPDWDNNWEHIIETFHSNYIGLKSTLHGNSELPLYELFRLLAYAYLKDYYQQRNSPNSAYFRNFPTAGTSLSDFIRILSTNYTRIMQLDFRQIFSDHPSQNQRIFPNNLTDQQLQYFKNLIQCLINYNSHAVANNDSPSYFFNLLTSGIYDRDEMHSEGKIMSDSELSNLLAALCIDSDTARVLDPGCGDGALLDAAYDQISLIASTANRVKSHNEILSQVDGLEIDPFLSQLAAFRLLTKNLTQVNNTTQANIQIGDIFQNSRPLQYDVVLMNSPFLRNDNHKTSISGARKTAMINAIQATGVNCFVSDAQQPNLYFYFVNYIWHYLNNNGKAGIILMAKFLNNKDGEHLKAFLLDKAEAIITYPRKYFQDFAVTTAIVILKNGNNSANISFLKIADENILLNPESVKSILNTQQDTVTASYKLSVVPRTSLNAADNWKNYINDRRYEDVYNLPLFRNIDHHFSVIARGNAESNGASTIIFPTRDNRTSSYKGYGKRPGTAQASQPRTEITLPTALNGQIGHGIQNNMVRRNFSLSLNDLSIDEAFHFPGKFDDTQPYGLLPHLQGNSAFVEFYNDCITEFTEPTWKKVVNSAFNNTLIPKILIPRADRTKHVVYYNPHAVNITLSSNFFYCNDLQNHNVNVNDELQYQFVSSFLLSVFGQIQFELNASNQEGLRKLEGFQIKRFRIPDLSSITQSEIDNVVNEFLSLNAANIEFSGDEGTNTPRRNLDIAIGSIIFSRDHLGFRTVEEMVDYFELFLADLVEDRRI